MYRDVYRHVYRHVYRRVYRHVCRRVYNMCTDMCVDMCIGMCIDMCMDVVIGVFMNVCVGICIGIPMRTGIDQCRARCPRGSGDRNPSIFLKKTRPRHMNTPSLASWCHERIQFCDVGCGVQMLLAQVPCV